MSKGERTRAQTRVPTETWERIEKELSVYQHESDSELLRYLIQDWIRMRRQHEPNTLSHLNGG